MFLFTLFCFGQSEIQFNNVKNNSKISQKSKKPNANFYNFFVTPQSVSLSIPSGESSYAIVGLHYANSTGGFPSNYANYNITPVTIDSGFLGVSPSFGSVAINTSATVAFQFSKTVTTNSTFTYVFKCTAIDYAAGYSVTEFIYIHVNYIAESCNLSAPSNLSINGITSQSAGISWNHVIGSDSYHSQYKEVTANDWTTISTSNGNGFSMIGLDPNTTYTTRVRTKCSNGLYSDWSNSVLFTTGSCDISPPYTITINPNPYVDDAADISWSNVSGNNGYHIQKRDENETIWTDINTSSGNGFTIIDLTPQTTYYIRIRTKCSDGDYGSWSNEVSMYNSRIASNISVFPNPSKGKIKIKSTTSIKAWSLTSSFGLELMNESLKTPLLTKHINISNLKSGMYLLRIELSNGEFVSKQIMKE